MESVEKLSRLCLVACDQSYWGGPLSNTLDENGPIAVDVVLAPHADSSVDMDVFPNTMPGTFYNPISTGLSEWKVFDRQDDAQSGFGATTYQRFNTDGTVDHMVAFQGTRGPSAQDWNGNLKFGVDKWVADAGGKAITQRLSELLVRGLITGDIYFAGQSLGGALAEYAAYDFRKEADKLKEAKLIDGLSNDRIALVTFNGLGGIAGLQKIAELREQAFDVYALQGSTIRHYWIAGDLVHRLGEGTGELQGQVHLNGQGNAYRLDFFAGPDADLPDTIDGQPRWKKAIEAHRIETGFYAGINYAPADFSFSANQQDVVPWHISELGNFASIFGNLYNSYDSARDGEATARIVATLIYGVAFGDKEEVQEVVNVVGESAYRSGIVNRRQYDVLRKSAPRMLTELASSDAGVNLQMRALILATILDSFEQSGTITRQTLETVARGSDLYNDTTRFPPNTTLDTVRTFALATFDQTLGKREDWTRASLEVARKIVADSVGDPALYRDVRRITREHLDELIPLLFEDDGLKAFGAKVAYYVLAARVDEAVAIGQVIGYVKSLVESGGKVPDVLPETCAEFGTEAIGFLSDLGRAVTNAIPEFIRDPGPPSGIVLDDFQSALEQRSVVDVFLQGLQSLANVTLPLTGAAEDESAAAIAEIQAVVSSAAQTIVVAPGHEANPFDDDSFDPSASPLASGTLTEGSLSTWTVYLPYEAGVGGQRIRLNVTEADANGLLVLSSGETVELDADGTFTITVAEGSRDATLEIAAFEDIDAGAAFTLSATLLNAAGEATHLEHEEAWIALDARVETPPVTAREIRGDWAPYTDAQGAPLWTDDGFGNVQRQPGVPNLSGFSEPDNKLDGSPDADHIVTGDLEDSVYAYAGDDVIEGSDLLGSIFVGGAGNDWIEAGRYDEHVNDYSEFAYLGRTIRLGEDKLYGGAGDDRIYGDRQADLAALYAPGTALTGLPGDWSSGGSGDDEVYGGAGDDVLMGGIGKDFLVGGAGMDVLLGDDHFYLRPEGNFWAVAHPNFGDANSGFRGFEVGLFPVVNIRDASSDVFGLTGDPYFTYYKDGGGADVLIGGAGKDILIGQAGADTLYGGEDDDILAGWEDDDRIIGGAGDDLMAGDFGRYELAGERVGGGTLLVSPGVQLFSSPSFAVNQAGNDFLDGGVGNDRVWGEGGADEVLGGDGDDVLYGDAPYLPEELHGADRVDGGAGDDELHGGGGDDSLFGGRGADRLSGDSGNDLLEGGLGDDQLSGGDGDDVLEGGAGADLVAGDAGTDTLHGGEGDDALDGGDGNDSLDGGRSDDILSGGGGDDLLDGGPGNDVLSGGAGDDTYALSLGYGADRIDDDEGASRLRFRSGIAPGALTATLDPQTLAATVSYGFVGDSVSVTMDQVDLSGVDFADGTRWGARQFLALVPALVSDGSTGADVLSGNEKLRNDLRGLEGDDLLIGSSNDDALEGGEGTDVLDGGLGADRYVFTADESGIDRLSDSGVSARAYLDWFYASRGIADWEERGPHGGQYRAESAGDEGYLARFVDYFDTFEEAFDADPFATITLVEPLPEIAPLIARNDAASLSWLEAAGVLDRDVVAFGPGLSLADLSLTISVSHAQAAGQAEHPWNAGATLSVRWGDAGFDLVVPDLQYGFAGTDGDPFSADWRGYRLGEGIEAFAFADGSTYSLEEILEHATLTEGTYSFLRGSGSQTIADDAWSVVKFGTDIDSSDVSAERRGDDLLFRLADGSAEGRIAGWYTDAAAVPPMSFVFADATALDAEAMTRLGLTRLGTAASELLQADPDFASALYGFEGADDLYGGAGNDLLDGGAGDDYMLGRGGNDTYLIQWGYGSDYIDEAPEDGSAGLDKVRFGQGIGPADISVGRDYGSLVLTIGSGTGSVTVLDWLDTPGGTIERFEFADGTVWDASTLASMLAPADQATDGDDVLFGALQNDVIDGLGGNDQLWGFAGSDTLDGGDGNDYLNGGSGNDIVRGGAGADYVEEIGADHNLVDGGPGDDYLYDEGHSLVIGGRGDDWIQSYGPHTVVLFNRGDGNDTIYAYDAFTLSLGGSLAPADLALTTVSALDVPGVMDYLLTVGSGDSVRFTRAYEQDPEAWPTISLQMFGSVHGYDFNAVIDEFRAAAGEDASFTLPLAGILQMHETSFSQTDALGGTLAWQYAITGTLDGLSDSAISAVLSDPSFGSARQPITIATRNRPPVVEHPLSGQMASEDAAFLFTIPANVFSDPDGGDMLTYAATLANGDPLPAWLTFDPTARTFSGTPANEDVGALTVAVSVVDQSDASVSDTFAVTVVNVNDSPLAVDDSAMAREDGGAVTLSAAGLLANDSDIDTGDSLSVAGVSGSGAGASVQLVNGDVVYNPGSLFQSLPEGATITDTFTYTVADRAGATASATVTTTIVGVNDAPVVTAPIGEHSGIEGNALAFGLPAGAFADIDDGDTLTFSARLADGSPLPAWLSFDPSSGAFAGTPSLEDGGDYTIRVSATDTASASASGDFRLTITDSLARGNSIVGTPQDDVLNGTSADELLDGSAGADRLFANGGDDILAFFADDRWKGMRAIAGKGRSLDVFDGGAGFDTLAGTNAGDAIFLDDRSILPDAYDGPRLLGIERIDAGGGRDIVDLTSRRFDYSDVIVDGGRDDDALWTSSGNDVLIGGDGNDELAGGAGNDHYVYSRGDGHDTIRDHAGADTLLFGPGIEQAKLRVERNRRDLVLRAGGGSVTIADWFASGRNRIERIEFADGTAWDMNAIEARIHDHVPGAGGPWNWPPSSNHEERSPWRDSRDAWPIDGHDGKRSEYDGVAAAISRLIAQYFHTDRQAGVPDGKKANAPTSPEEIARRWAAGQRYVERLTYETEDMDSAAGSHEWQSFGVSGPLRGKSIAFGFDASVGFAPPPNGLQSFVGLNEGFQHL